MELRQLKYFVKAAETLNFSEAALSVCDPEYPVTTDKAA